MIRINVITNHNNWFNYIKNPNNYIDKKISKINLKEKKLKKNNFFCTLLLSNNKEIKYLNKKFRKKNKTTDVLSFPFNTKTDLKKKIRKEKEIYIGDIIINLNKIHSKHRLKNFTEEFDRLWIHGLLHLFGYDHKKEKDFQEMSRIEKKFYNFANV